MNIDKKSFKKMFPHLAEELEGGGHKITINAFRSDVEVAEKASSERFEGYNPDVIDFIRRCDREEQLSLIHI